MYTLLTKDGLAKRGRLETVHGTIETPVFMNVGTVGAIKGAVSTDDLKMIGTQVELSNTYHSACADGGCADQEVWRTPQVYGVGQADPDGLRWISGVFPLGAPAD